MILHTNQPFEMIFPTELTLKNINVNGIPAEAFVYNGEAYLNRIYSTNPSEYLNENAAPGRIINGGNTAQ